MSLVWDCPPYTEFVQSGLQILSSANFAFFFWRFYNKMYLNFSEVFFVIIYQFSNKLNFSFDVINGYQDLSA